MRRLFWLFVVMSWALTLGMGVAGAEEEAATPAAETSLHVQVMVCHAEAYTLWELLEGARHEFESAIPMMNFDWTTPDIVGRTTERYTSDASTLFAIANSVLYDLDRCMAGALKVARADPAANEAAATLVGELQSLVEKGKQLDQAARTFETYGRSLIRGAGSEPTFHSMRDFLDEAPWNRFGEEDLKREQASAENLVSKMRP